MRIEKSPSAVFTPLPDGTGVLLNIDTLVYYKLNRTGASVWQRLEEGTAVTLETLVLKTCERFEVDQQTARQTVSEFVDSLRESNMVRLLESETSNG
jgi:hypothetical protein